MGGSHKHRIIPGRGASCCCGRVVRLPPLLHLGPARSLRALLDSGFGQLAAGPRPLIERYAEALRNSGVAVSSPPSRSPVWWDGTRWVEEVKPLFAVILGASYVVSPAVTAERG